ncbi:MAG: YifB family Mg chelatase-like AAA ATPase [Gammaproteobacteria bacterium]|jgi:magnesium chelatase family protein|nr:YifB family Mg chelatase-like AAA ATPase [Gammaproteobacteria bacterium]
MQSITVRCRAQSGLDAPPVSVEVFPGPGLPGLVIVGLVETAIKESRDRVRAALLNSGYTMPDRRIVVSLAPADLPKSGSRYDLAIAIGILCASRQLPAAQLQHCELYGELGLSGELRPIAGALPAALQCVAAGRRAILPAANAAEAGLAGSPNVLLADDLATAAGFLAGTSPLDSAPPPAHETPVLLDDLSDLVGQHRARRGLEIAAAGGHHLLLSGPPGTGKSMLARRLPGILPRNSVQQAQATAAMYSLRSLQPADWPVWRAPPFRAPHHTASAAALAGGGSHPRPGEISLAHNGVLFLDELPEFQRNVLEVLREPLETGRISLARAHHSVTFPAEFQLVAAMNPCPCGYRGDPLQECRCTPDQVNRYARKISGPFLDRIDLHIELAREPSSFAEPAAAAEDSASVRRRVCKAREQASRDRGKLNARLSHAELRALAWPEQEGLKLLDQAATRFGLSRRACDRVLRVARTIADLGQQQTTGTRHIAEALSLRLSA